MVIYFSIFLGIYIYINIMKEIGICMQLNDFQYYYTMNEHNININKHQTSSDYIGGFHKHTMGISPKHI
jgi:hypothetical protein